MNRKIFDSCLAEADFHRLFVEELGWNNAKGKIQLPEIDGVAYTVNVVAERSGFKILTCQKQLQAQPENGSTAPSPTWLPNHSLARKIDSKLQKEARDYICIFVADGEHQQWVVPVKTVERRDLVTVEYLTARQADFLYYKMEDITFDLTEETTIVEVKRRVQEAFMVNSEKLTKDFYASFRKEHKAFAEFIQGIEVEGDKQWYASVMLNRLMFCYFIQKKGFLDFSTNYLQEKLKECKRKRGENKFFSTFYRGFLCQLFQGGLNSPKHDDEFEVLYGSIPYLNGGMFDEHQLERQYKDLDIDDKAFERLFDFFDKWEWHLDTRITASGRDINPDVLGYIFEQYINDRAQMGAYYTKEDITEYIGKNCIIPFLMEQVAKTSSSKDFGPKGYVWATLRESGDSYIYDAVKKGVDKPLPDYIEQGVDTAKPNLLERRNRWNERTTEDLALPTEIWRETVERRQRCESLREKIASGEITHINDFITYNLDIRQFAYDLIRDTNDHLFVEHFYHALQHITILDPTCGSGAFLFAALNILEPLYDICIDRMEAFHQQNPRLFNAELDELANKYRSNRQYFIYKSIILRNLYGVDIMVEATEVAKLRLFLKMVAVVDADRRAENMGLDPLPDIDFNIRCGNTLVGYATEEELKRDLDFAKDILEEIANKELKEKVEMEMDKVAKTYEKFRTIQLTQSEDLVTFKDAKQHLRDRLTKLNDLLSRKLYKSTNLDSRKSYEEWQKTHQPFHWLAEFYQIMHGNGGFDVIIGNPPYVEYPSENVKYRFDMLVSKDCGNLYGNCIERGFAISNKGAVVSYIIPVAITCSKRMSKVIDILTCNSKLLIFANFDDRPGKLFEMIQHLRATIFISLKGREHKPSIMSTKYNRWYTECRNTLFDTIQFVEVTPFVTSFTIPKFSRQIECAIDSKLLAQKKMLGSLCRKNNNSVYYRAAGGGYFLLIKDRKSVTYIDGVLEDVKAEKCLSYNIKYSNAAIGAFLSSTLFYWCYIAHTDCRNLSKVYIDNFPIVEESFIDEKLIHLGTLLFDSYEKNKYTKNTIYKTTGRNVVYDEYYPKLSKPIIDEIDKVLAKHYGFTDEELDFIINYDIKYRMGDELNEK